MDLERKFSKELAGDLRQETANKLRQARNQPANFNELKKELNDSGKLSEEYNFWLHGQEGKNFEELNNNIFGKLFKTEKYKQQSRSLEELLKEKKHYDINGIYKEYEHKFQEILSSCPLSLEEREKYLSTKAMEQMPLNDYLTLLKRLSGEAFYHVTRYGVRENTFMSTSGGHNFGKGALIDGFTPLLKDGNINSCTSTVITNTERARSVINPDYVKQSKEQGKSVSEVVDEFMANYGSDYFLDRESAHFSYGEEKHHMYGGENNYKFYFYFPVEYILQNDFYYKTREAQLTIGNSYFQNETGIRQQYNDFEIFNFGRGVPINAGILCISKTEVDPETGSQYLLNEGRPVLDDRGEFKKPTKTITSQEYWEKYFTLHPELKPNKIIYGNFETNSYESNSDLMELAKDKHIYNQDDVSFQEFKQYTSDSRVELRSAMEKAVQELFNVE